MNQVEEQVSLSSDEIQRLRELSLSDFYFFAKFVVDFVNDTSWLKQSIHQPLADMMSDYENNIRVKITLPRSWLKSSLATIAYSIWRAVKNPNIRILIVQNTSKNAEKKLAAIRGQFEANPLLRTLFPEVLPGRDNRWTNQAIELTRTARHPEATIETAGTKTKLTSRHYDVIIEDDTVAPDLDEMGEENIAPTKDDIDQAIGFHKNCIPLLVDILKSQIVVVGTRWFQVDLLSWIADNEPSYVSVERAVRETDGKPDPEGSIVWPERFGEEALKAIQDGMGFYMFSCLYMNCPLSSEEMPFRKSMFQYYSELPTGLVVVTTIDPAGGKIRGSKTKKQSDYQVVISVGKDFDTGLMYVLEVSRFRGTPGHLIDAIFRHQKTWGSLIVGIEAVQYQNALDYFVLERQRQTGQYFRVEMIKSLNAKESRIRALEPVVRANSLLFHSELHSSLINELTVFPYGKFDDQADALSMVLQLFAATRIKERTELNTLVPGTLEHTMEEMSQQLESHQANLVGEMLFSSTNEVYNPLNYQVDYGNL